jgi:CelD/BcsL family acetyltransferase involved in cellulose biosynthesis
VLRKDAHLRVLPYEAGDASPVRPVQIVTRATSLAAFRRTRLPADPELSSIPRRTDLTRELAPGIALRVYKNLSDIENNWRHFEKTAECTPFQTFEWLAAWQRNIGAPARVTPAIVVGRFGDGNIAFIMPLAIVQGGWVRRLRWLGQDLCDYNAPLLAHEFSQAVSAGRFLKIWREVRALLQSDQDLHHDCIDFEKMPQTIGVQINPFMHLRVTPNANSAHITNLEDDWEKFYRSRRSSATRRHDRSKRRHMAEFGEIRFVTSDRPDDVRKTLDALWQQKKVIFARKGITDIFARPGYRDFFLDFASDPQTSHLAHVSRVEIGGNCAAANFGIVFGDCYYHVLSSYCDGKLTRFGPGRLHLRELLAHAIKLGLRQFDFTIGDEDYKFEWSNLRLGLFDHGAAASWRGWPVNIASKMRHRLKHFVKHTPVLWRLVCRIRSATGPI